MKWEIDFLELAKFWAEKKSKDPSTKTGSVIVDPFDKSIISIGYNGFPRGVKDTEERLNNRDLKYKLILHSDLNSVLFADRNRLRGSYYYGYPWIPCVRCCVVLIQVGIKRIVAYKHNLPERWTEEMNLTREICQEANVELIEYEK